MLNTFSLIPAFPVLMGRAGAQRQDFSVLHVHHLSVSFLSWPSWELCALFPLLLPCSKFPVFSLLYYQPPCPSCSLTDLLNIPLFPSAFISSASLLTSHSWNLLNTLNSEESYMLLPLMFACHFPVLAALYTLIWFSLRRQLLSPFK